MIKVQRISTTEAFSVIRTEWNDLLSRSNVNSVFLTWEWAFSWWESFSEKNNTLFILIASIDDKIVAIAPLVITKRIFFNFLSIKEINFLGKKTVHGEYLDFIIASNCKEKKIVESIFTYLDNNRKQWDILRLTDIPENSINIEYLADIALHKKYRFIKQLTTICPFILLPESWQTFQRSLKKNIRNNLKKQNRRLQKQFELKLDLYDPLHVNEELECLWALHEMRWKTKGLPGAFIEKKKQKFYYSIADRFSKKNWLQLWFLKINSRPVAALFGCKYENKIYALQAGFDPELSKYSIGQVLLGKIIENAISNNCYEFDFLRGTESYKYDWGAIDRRNIKLDISHPGIKTTLFYAMSFLKNNLPEVYKRYALFFKKVKKIYSKPFSDRCS